MQIVVVCHHLTLAACVIWYLFHSSFIASFRLLCIKECVTLKRFGLTNSYDDYYMIHLLPLFVNVDVWTAILRRVHFYFWRRFQFLRALWQLPFRTAVPKSLPMLLINWSFISSNRVRATCLERGHWEEPMHTISVWIGIGIHFPNVDVFRTN